jgi:hypothetical protein
MWHLEAVEDLIDHLDEGGAGLVQQLVTQMDVSGEVDDRGLASFVLKYLLAPISPVLNVEPKCFRQSLAYFKHLLSLDAIWPFQSNFFKYTWSLKNCTRMDL